MKNFMFALVLTGLAFVVFGFADPVPADNPVYEIVPLNDVSCEMMDSFRDGQLQGTAIEFPQGTRIPLDLFLHGDAFTTEKEGEGQIYLTMLQNIYVSSDGNDLFFSQDAVNWKGFAEFFTGVASFQIGVVEDEPVLRLGAELMQRN